MRPNVYLSYQVDVQSCDYLIDLDFPLHAHSSALEPRYATLPETWDRVFCAPFLDAENSPLFSRTMYTGIRSFQAQNAFGDYCLLGNRARISKIEKKKWQRQTAKLGSV